MIAGENRKFFFVFAWAMIRFRVASLPENPVPDCMSNLEEKGLFQM